MESFVLFCWRALRFDRSVGKTGLLSDDQLELADAHLVYIEMCAYALADYCQSVLKMRPCFGQIIW